MIEGHLHIQRGEFTLAAEFEISEKGVTGIFGPSGSGKSTLLRAVAGLEKAEGNLLRVGTEIWQDRNTFLEPHEREVGYVFQHSALFTHLNVERNLEYGLNRTDHDIFTKAQVLELLSLHHLCSRDVATLSGGERQRVAIGRALLRNPKWLLLDEPLASLDEGSRELLMPVLKEVVASAQIPILYVSHSRKEVATFTESLLLMEAGRIVSSGETASLLS